MLTTNCKQSKIVRLVLMRSTDGSFSVLSEILVIVSKKQQEKQTFARQNQHENLAETSPPADWVSVQIKTLLLCITHVMTPDLSVRTQGTTLIFILLCSSASLLLWGNDPFSWLSLSVGGLDGFHAQAKGYIGT